MGDVFSASGATYGGSFSANAAKLVFTGPAGADDFSGGVGLLTQSFNVNYAQQVTRLYEVGGSKVYLISGRTQGQMGINRVLGPKAVKVAFYRNYGNTCNAESNNIQLQFTANCNSSGTGETVTVKIQNLVLTSVALQVAAQDMIISEQLGAVFVALDFVDGPAGGAVAAPAA